MPPRPVAPRRLPFATRWKAVGVFVGAGIVIGGWLLLAGFPVGGVLAAVVGLETIALLGLRYRKEPREVARCLFLVPVALLHAVAPLLLVVLFLVLYASQAASRGYQVAAAILFAVAVTLVAGAEWELLTDARTRTKAAWSRGGWAFLDFAWLPLTALALPTVAGAVVFVVTPAVPGVERIGGFPAVVQSIGLVLLVVAAVLRLLAFTRVTKTRVAFMPVVAVAAVMIVIIWMINGGDALLFRDVGWLLIAVVALFILALWEADVALNSPGPIRTPPREATGPALVGLVCAFGGAAAVALALVWVHYEQGRPPPSREGAPKAGQLAKFPAAYTDDQLARMFAPVLHFEPEGDEPWLPESVNRFVRDAVLLDLAGKGNCADCTDDPTLFRLPKECTTDEDSCFVLSCAEGAGECQAKHSSTDVDRATIYARVARKKSEPRTFRGPAEMKNTLTVLVQYWLFYPYDKWRAYTPFGWLIQEHEGDWESVTVGLAGKNPRFVAYSAHCGGEWRDWDDELDVVAADFDGKTWDVKTGADTGLHPLVAVASGSHANYHGAWGKRPPDWGTCRRLRKQAVWALSYASNVRDRTGSTRTVKPRVIVVRGGHPAMAFSGHWGQSEIVSIGVWGRKEIGKPGRGPTSPAHKDIWRRPLATIFCGKHWTPDLCG